MLLKKQKTSFKTLVLSRHPSHNILRTNLKRLPFRSLIRLGSTTVKNDFKRIECNSVQSVKNSASKLLMKQCFTKASVKTADWFIFNNTFNKNGNESNRFRQQGSNNDVSIINLPYPIICKHVYGSRGEGNSLVNNPEEFEKWMRGKTLSNYIFEKYYTFTKEYRLHVTEDGCFYACRKMLKRDTPKNEKFQRHNDNSVWILENNPDFDKPNNWDEIVKDCVKALKSLGGDIMGFDVKVQSNKDKKNVKRKTIDYIIIESNSACSFGTITAERYLNEIPKILLKKYANQKR
jgi:hypothetical protein